MDHALVSAISVWMRDKALPLWSKVGLDGVHGGAVESLQLNAQASAGAPFKRARVACRQLYVFSHAQILGWPGAAEAADQIFDHLVSRFWQGPGQGWARRLTPAGDILDPTPDLYDYAFALFALAWRFKATGAAEALSLAHQTLDIVETRFAHPGGEGFHNEIPPTLPRQQNPHMHMTEAALALCEATGEPRFAALADQLAHLFMARLARFPEGVLPEFFDDSWGRAPGDEGRWVEPGHQFEWAWILAQHQKLRGADQTAAITALVARAERYGVDPQTQITFNRVRDDGLVLDQGTRVWPNTERIKGWLGLYEVTGTDPKPAVAGSAKLLLTRMLSDAPDGAWIDAYDAGLCPVVSTVPASTLYHLFLAFSEVLRIAPQVLADSPSAKPTS